MPIGKKHVDAVRMTTAEIILVALVEHVSARANDTNHGFIGTGNHSDPHVVGHTRISFTHHDCFAEPIGNVSELNAAVGEKDSIRLEGMILVRRSAMTFNFF